MGLISNGYSRMIAAIILALNVWVGVMADDVVIDRMGRVARCKVDSVGEDAIWILPRFDNVLLNMTVKHLDLTPERVRINEIYMIKTSDGLNVFFHPKGVRDTVPNRKPDKTADLIYLIEGKEIQGWNAEINGNGNVDYYSSNPKKKGFHSKESVSMDNVFMIRYSDGKKEVVRELDIIDDSMDGIDYDALEQEREIQLKEMTFNLSESMTVGDIAKIYGVTVDQLIKWNKWPDNINGRSRLKAGSTVWITEPTQPFWPADGVD